MVFLNLDIKVGCIIYCTLQDYGVNWLLSLKWLLSLLLSLDDESEFILISVSTSICKVGVARKCIFYVLYIHGIEQ